MFLNVDKALEFSSIIQIPATSALFTGWIRRSAKIKYTLEWVGRNFECSSVQHIFSYQKKHLKLFFHKMKIFCI